MDLCSDLTTAVDRCILVALVIADSALYRALDIAGSALYSGLSRQVLVQNKDNDNSGLFSDVFKVV